MIVSVPLGRAVTLPKELLPISGDIVPPAVGRASTCNRGCLLRSKQPVVFRRNRYGLLSNAPSERRRHPRTPALIAPSLEEQARNFLRALLNCSARHHCR